MFELTTVEPNASAVTTETLENRPATQLYWSPKGSMLVLANWKNFTGGLEFFNADLMETIGESDHAMASKLSWDPAGRFVTSTATTVGCWRVGVPLSLVASLTLGGCGDVYSSKRVTQSGHSKASWCTRS